MIPLEPATPAALWRRHRRVNRATALAAAISHDLQGPITRLRLRADQIADRDLRERITADLDRVAAMLQEQLDYVRSGHLREAQVSLNLAALVEAVTENMLDLGYRVSVRGRLRGSYQGAPRALERVLQNLVTNAVVHGGGAAAVRMTEGAMGAAIFVLDEGPGIDEALIERVFEPFFRIESARSGGGSGLGLAIARNLVRAHGGDIQLCNRPKGGLQAMMTLPAAAHSPARRA
jgi:signal transduction histidine kinase